VNAGGFLKRGRDEGAAGTEDDLCVENACAALALQRIRMANLSFRQVIGLSNLVGQAAVHQGVVPAAKLLAPDAILDQPLEDLVQAETREIFTPYWHPLFISS